MKKFLFYIICFVLLLLLPAPARAGSVPVAGTSGMLSAYNRTKTDQRDSRLRRFLSKYNSPLISYSKFIVLLADKYEIDWRLVTAIAGVESTFCRAIPYNSYNCWGWKNGKHAFSGYTEALEKVSKTLGTRYYGRGLDTPEAIAPVYAPPSSTWARNVRFFMNRIEDDASSSFLAQQFSI